MAKCLIEILEDTLDSTDHSDGDDSYIEIELDAAPTCHIHDQTKSTQIKGSCMDKDDAECDQWRISISSTISVSFSDVQKEGTNVHNMMPNVAAIGVPCMPSLMSCSADDDTVSFNPTVSSEFPQPETKFFSGTRVIPCDNVDVPYTRRLVNPSNARYTTKSKEQGRKKKHWDLEDYSICDSLRSSKKYSSRVMEMDLGAVRGIFNAMGMMSIARKSSTSKREAGSSSCNTTPIHEGSISLCSSSENSIQAAIAYCKSSLGQTSDFSFRSSISSSPSLSLGSIHD
ncbi:hypothetical protein RJT34_17818 [Clitoria ternatea]|uniref:Uncharacterized protein n=1 Tax=Clitoria ternatea TaxID=43366 RepID=A0AAN9PEU9_CLITE